MFDNLRRISLDQHLLLRTKLKMDKDFIMPGSLCAIAASENSPDTVWFVKINIAEGAPENNMIDDYGNTIFLDHKFFQAK